MHRPPPSPPLFPPPPLSRSHTWQLLRHRVAPPVKHALDAAIADGSLQVEGGHLQSLRADGPNVVASVRPRRSDEVTRSEEHTSELQSRQYLVCRLLLEKKKT